MLVAAAVVRSEGCQPMSMSNARARVVVGMTATMAVVSFLAIPSSTAEAQNSATIDFSIVARQAGDVPPTPGFSTESVLGSGSFNLNISSNANFGLGDVTSFQL